MDVACFCELGRTWDFQETEVTECHLLHPNFSLQLWFQCVRYVSAQPDAENFAGDGKTSWTWTYWSKYNRIYPDPPTWNPVWDHSSSAHLAGHKKHIRGWRGLGSTCWKRRENTVVVHSRSIKLMVSLCVHHLSQGFHLALLNCYLYYVVFSKWWMFHDSKRLGMTERSHNLIHPVSSFCTSRLLWFWTRMKGEWLIGSVTRTTNRFTAINIYIYIYLQCI